jgi:hypothetical protein
LKALEITYCFVLRGTEIESRPTRRRADQVRSKVHRSNRHIFTNAANVIERQTIDPTGIAIAMSTGVITLVGEPKADRKTFAGGFSIISATSQ